MKNAILIIYGLFLCFSLVAQNNEPIRIKAGTRVIDSVPFAERYQYPGFTKGKITLNDGRSNICMFNLNLLSGEMEFLQGKDTLFIAEKKEISKIVIAKDTFLYHDNYLRLIKGGKLKIYMNQRFAIVDVLKKGAMGTINRTAASESYDYFNSTSNSYNLKVDQEIVLKKTANFYFSLNEKDFILFNNKNTSKIVPDKNGIIKEYLKTNDIDFRSATDILKLGDFLKPLLNEKTAKSK
jgi:hypothetical protein